MPRVHGVICVTTTKEGQGYGYKVRVMFIIELG